MRCLLAFDKFKDALTARQACEAAADALRQKHPDWQLDLCPLTDGGEGFCEMLTQAAKGRLDCLAVTGPRGGEVLAPVGYVSSSQLSPAACARLKLKPASTLAVVGMASASGLELLPHSQRDPWHTTSHGTGQLIRAATNAGVEAILLGVGGSATNDLGFGALAALGFKFFDLAGAIIAQPTPQTWDVIGRIEGRATLPAVFIACDVTNPLLGPHGATATFGPQKGLQPADLPRLETEMARMAALLCDACGQPRSLADTPGTGAAGGIGFGLMVACGSRLIPGFDLVSAWLDLPARLAAADLVLTGEGRYDATSLGGKGPGRLVALARQAGKPAQVFAGSFDGPALGGADSPPGVSLHPITPAGMPLAAALPRTVEFLAAAVARVV